MEIRTRIMGSYVMDYSSRFACYNSRGLLIHSNFFLGIFKNAAFSKKILILENIVYKSMATVKTKGDVPQCIGFKSCNVPNVLVISFNVL